MKELSRQTRIRYLMTLLILITIPCYLLGFILLKLDRGPQPSKPTRTPTATEVIVPTEGTPPINEPDPTQGVPPPNINP